MARPDVGDRAPEFETTDAQGEPLRLSDLRGRPVVLFFYPHDFTMVCTRQNCAFRDEHGTLGALGAEVIGVSPDPPERHVRFARKHDLPFRQVSDSDGELRRLYGVRPFLGLVPGRVTFVIDEQGIVRERFQSQYRGPAHAEAAVQALRSLAGPSEAETRATA